MINILKIFSESNVRILKLVAEHDGLHIREIAEKAGINPATAHGAIKLFEEMGFVSEKRIKNRKAVFINKESIILGKIKSLLNIFEILNSRSFKSLEKYGTVGIYGSFARGEDTAESDIDLWLYSNKKQDLMKLKAITRELEKRFGKEVKLLVLDDEKIKKIKKDDPEFYFRLKLTSAGEDVFG